MSKKLTIQDCQDIATLKGGFCLSTEYMHSHHPMLWRCSCGYEWCANLNSIKNCDTWCKVCSGHKDISIKDCYDTASSLNGICNDTIYINNKVKILWTCSKGHNFYMSFNKVQQGRWCPHCSIDKSRKTCLERYGVDNPMKNIDVARRSARGFCKTTVKHWKTGEILECSSSYETKVVDYLNFNNINYIWQPRLFHLKDGSTYRPDLYLVDNDMWVEIKGRWYDKSKKKWDLFVDMIDNIELWDKNKLLQLGIMVK